MAAVNHRFFQAHSEESGLTSGSCVGMSLCTIQIRLPLPLSARALDSRYPTLGALHH
jgi:hypothetical protein